MSRSSSLRVGFWQPLWGDCPERLCDQLHEILSSTSLDVLILPERFSTGGRIDPVSLDMYGDKPLEQEPTLQRLSELAGQYGIHIIAGMIEYEHHHRYSTAVRIDCSGFFRVHRKTRLLPAEADHLDLPDTQLSSFETDAPYAVALGTEWISSFPDPRSLTDRHRLLCHCAVPVPFDTLASLRLVACRHYRWLVHVSWADSGASFGSESALIDPHGHIRVQSRPDRPQFNVTSIPLYHDNVIPSAVSLTRGTRYQGWISWGEKLVHWINNRSSRRDI
jgi:hypothetical protein